MSLQETGVAAGGGPFAGGVILLRADLTDPLSEAIGQEKVMTCGASAATAADAVSVKLLMFGAATHSGQPPQFGSWSGAGFALSSQPSIPAIGVGSAASINEGWGVGVEASASPQQDSADPAPRTAAAIMPAIRCNKNIDAYMVSLRCDRL